MAAPLNGNCTEALAADNAGPLIGTLGWIEAAMAVKVMAVRFLVQRFVVGRLEWADWLMLVALVCNNEMYTHLTDPPRLWPLSTLR